MRVIVACEESQAVCIAFRERGREAYSCDIQPCNYGEIGGDERWLIFVILALLKTLVQVRILT